MNIGPGICDSPRWKFALIAVVLFLLLVGLHQPATAQVTLSFQRERGRVMLEKVKNKIKDDYYDPTFHGVDLEAQFKDADNRIKNAQSSDEIYTIIARFTLLLDDSHTFFAPPSRFVNYDYGWNMQSVGEGCLVTAVEPGSDAEAKGLKEGDQILSIAGMNPKREDFWLVEYLLNALHPQASVELVVRTASSQPREIKIATKMTHGKRMTDLSDEDEVQRMIVAQEIDARLYRHRYVEMGKDALIWKMPGFDLPKDKVDDIMERARKFQTLIIDLRGNGGGAEETLLRLIGNLFGKEVKIGDLKRRKEQKPLLAKSRGDNIFSGKLIVLVDSGSASASELLARVVQLEKRGTVIGDRTAGAVMRSNGFSDGVGVDTFTVYGASITDADVIMTDGKSLEKVGVTPDELLLPTQADLAARRDPVMSRACLLAGIQVDPVKAGTMFPVEWKK